MPLVLQVRASVRRLSESLVLWDLATKKITPTLTDPHGQDIWAVAFAPNGTTLATGDGSTYLWRIGRRSS